MALIYLVRHGETQSNAERIFQIPEEPLSARGLEQAERLGRRLAGMSVGLILSSDYLRAVSTAQIIAQHTGAPITYEPDLRERNVGALRGRPYAELGPDIFSTEYVPPGGESFPEFERRVARAWSGVVARAAGLTGALAVVTHGFVCRTLLDKHLKRSATDTAFAIAFANCSLTVVDVSARPQVQLLNCGAHLLD